MEDSVAPGEAPVITAEMAGIEEVQDGAKPAMANRNGKKAETSSGGGSFFTWFIVLALLGVWTSVAVVYFDLVDYQGVLDKAKGIQINLSEALQGKLVAYDTDGDGDFDVEDAKILLDDQPGGGAKAGVKREPHRPSPAHLKLREALKLQVSLIHERVEAKKLARMALAEVRQLLAEEGEETRALELGRANMSARVRARVAARLREEEEKMEREEVEKALERVRMKKRAEEEERRKNESRGEEERLERRVEGRAKQRPKKNKAEKS